SPLKAGLFQRISAGSRANAAESIALHAVAIIQPVFSRQQGAETCRALILLQKCDAPTTRLASLWPFENQKEPAAFIRAVLENSRCGAVLDPSAFEVILDCKRETGLPHVGQIFVGLWREHGITQHRELGPVGADFGSREALIRSRGWQERNP